MKKLNRIKSRTASRTRYWCMNCDAQLIAPGEKCPNCGKRSDKNKTKKNNLWKEDIEDY
jgi:hypothetical protein